MNDEELANIGMNLNLNERDNDTKSVLTKDNLKALNELNDYEEGGEEGQGEEDMPEEEVRDDVHSL